MFLAQSVLVQSDFIRQANDKSILIRKLGKKPAGLLVDAFALKSGGFQVLILDKREGRKDAETGTVIDLASG